MIENRKKHAGVIAALFVLGLASITAYGASPGGVPHQAVNLNTASVSELESLPGVGEVRARAIIAERKQQGGFRSLDQLAAVKGIGPKLLERIRPQVTLGEGPVSKRP
jgi:competence protein ComEA